MNPYWTNLQTEIYNGDALEVMKELPEQSVDVILTSPPYFGLRKYKAPDTIYDNHNGCEHEWNKVKTTLLHENRNNQRGTQGQVLSENKELTHIFKTSNIKTGFCSKCGAWQGQLGLEPAPELYIKHLCDILDGCKRVLKKTGTLWVNIDDSYAGSFQGHGTDRNKTKEIYPDNVSPSWSGFTVLPKSLIAIPARFQIEMLNRGWICRQVIIWHKGNPMPESVKDRFTSDFEYLFMFSQSHKYYFEQQFEKVTQSSIFRLSQNIINQIGSGRIPCKTNGNMKAVGNQFYRNRRAVWKINTKGLKEAHFATFPSALCTIPILAGCPECICIKCGKPREKLYEKGFTSHESQTEGGKVDNTKRLALLRQAARAEGNEYQNQNKFIGYSDCNCNAGFYPGTVLDIFGGSGTVALEACKLGRKAILIDISKEYCDIAIKRLSKCSIPINLGEIK